ncbi:hypothetical protein FV296_18800 [Escherichia coli]|nr:hypothetical protein FV296_18800 [Escherichia coli]
MLLPPLKKSAPQKDQSKPLLEVSELRDQLAQNTLSLIEIVKAVKINSIIPVESLLANHVIRELHKSS